MVFSRVGQSMYELVNEGLNDTGWDKELGVIFLWIAQSQPLL